jgi:hypothetical protein
MQVLNVENSVVPPVMWGTQDLTALGEPQIMRVTSGGASLDDGMYYECGFGTTVFDVACSDSVVSLEALPSHLALVSDDDVSVTKATGGNFRVTVSSGGMTADLARSRMILTLVATDANGTKAYKGLSLRFAPTEQAADEVIFHQVASYDGTYDGAEHGIEVSVAKPAGATVRYSLAEQGPYSEDAIAFKDVTEDAVTVWYTVDAENCASVTNFGTVRISPKPLTGAMVSVEAADFSYDGAPKTPAVAVADGDPSVLTDADYSVAYYDNTAAGEATVKVAGRGNYTGEVVKHFTIAKAEVSPPVVASKPYTGAEQSSGVESTDFYSVSDAVGTDAGDYDVVLTLTDAKNYRWTGGDSNPLTLTFTISKAPNSWVEKPSVAGWTYGQTANMPYLGAPKFGTATVVYSVPPLNAGVYMATFSVPGTENYDGLDELVQFEISKAAYDMSGAGWDAPSFTYDGEPKTVLATGLPPGVSVAHYSGHMATDAGVYTALATLAFDTVNYEMPSMPSCNWSIARKSVAGAEVTLGPTLTYTGAEQTQAVGGVKIDGLDATFVASDDKATNAGTYTLTVTGTGNFTGSATAEWTMSPKPLTDAMVSIEETRFFYDGTPKTPAVTVADGDPSILTDADYSVAYYDNTEAGEATVKVAGRGNYTGDVVKHFTIISYEKAKLEEVFAGLPAAVESDAAGGCTVTLTNDLAAADLPVEIPDDLGNVAIDLNGHDVCSTDAGLPAFRVVPGEDAVAPTRLALVTTGGDAVVQGGEEAPAVEVAADAQAGVVVDIGAGVTVKGGDDFTDAVYGTIGECEGTVVEPSRIRIPGYGTVTVPKTWKANQKVTWKATAAKGSVFAHWEGPLVDSLGLSANELRNPSLQFMAPADLDTNDVRAVFIALDSDRLSSLGMTQTEFGFKEAVSGVWVVDDSKSYVTASASGLPAGLKLDAKTLAITGAPTKSGVYCVQIKAKNASGYQWAENVKVVVSGGGAEAKVPKLTRTAYYPLTVLTTNAVGGTVTGTGVYADGKKASIKATAAKNFVFAGWYRDMALEQPMSFVAGDWQSASQNVVVPEVTYLFAKFVTTDYEMKNIKLSVADEALSGKTPVWTNYCGVALRWSVEAGAPTATTVKAAGLPSGVKLVQDKKTKAYSLEGVPTAASKADKSGVLAPSKVKLTVTAAGKSSRVFDVDWVVLPLPAWAVGTFDGSAWEAGSAASAPAEAAADGPATSGLVSLTVAANGKISGKKLSDGLTWTLAAASFNRVEEYGDLAFCATVVGKSGKTAFTNEVTVVAGEDLAVPGGKTAKRGVATSEEWTAWQNLWKTEPWKTTVAKPFAKAKALELHVVEDEEGTPVVAAPSDGTAPYGVLTLKFAASGAATASCKFTTYDAKGKPVVYSASCSSPLVPLPAGGYRLFLYFPPKAGKFDGYSAAVDLGWDGADFKLAE